MGTGITGSVSLHCLQSGSVLPQRREKCHLDVESCKRQQQLSPWLTVDFPSLQQSCPSMQSCGAVNVGGGDTGHTALRRAVRVSQG